MNLSLPLSICTDSYKASHPFQYPEARAMSAYGEFRSNMDKNPDEERIVFYGLRFLYDNYLNKRWTEADVEAADKFYATHNAGFTPFAYPKDLFLKFIRENDGFFPVRVQALRDGTVAYPHVPVYQITARNEYARLVTFLETVLTMVWYPSTVATRSRRVRQYIEDAFERSVEKSAAWKLDSRLHDFGFRGCTTVEQSVVGGVAHLLSFRGSDTMSACYYAQFVLNNGAPVAQTVPATEHSVMTSWPNERAAILNMIERFGDGVYSIVMDSYDYENALFNVVPTVREAKEKKGGFMVFRPDSGDPVEAVLMGLRAGEQTFGADTNAHGFKVLRNCGVIQGDGIDGKVLQRILDAVLEAGYSAENVVFGMGGGLLQRCNRDTMSFATKLSFIEYANGETRDVMKVPKTDGGKCSMPGFLSVKRNADGVPVVLPGDINAPIADDDLLEVVYDNGPVAAYKWETFDEMRARVEREWHALPRVFDPISPAMHAKMDAGAANVRAGIAAAKSSSTA